MKPIHDYHLVLLIGPSGAGKTTHLSDYPNYLHLDQEQHLDPLLGYQRKYYPAVSRIARVMRLAGFEAARLTGINLAITIGGARRSERRRFIAPARAAGYRVTIVLLKTPADECLRRARADSSRPKTTHWQPIIAHWFNRFEAIESDEYDEYLEVT